MALTPEEIDRRWPVWQAMSSLFLDTQMQHGDCKHLARAIVASGYSPAQVHAILWNEVFPALADNLRVVAGEWAGFDDGWLRQRIVDVLTGDAPGPSPCGMVSVGAARRAVAQAWTDACRHLPPAFRGGIG